MPVSVKFRIKRPIPCFSLMTISGTLTSINASVSYTHLCLVLRVERNVPLMMALGAAQGAGLHDFPAFRSGPILRAFASHENRLLLVAPGQLYATLSGGRIWGKELVPIAGRVCGLRSSHIAQEAVQFLVIASGDRTGPSTRAGGSIGPHPPESGGPGRPGEVEQAFRCV